MNTEGILKAFQNANIDCIDLPMFNISELEDGWLIVDGISYYVEILSSNVCGVHIVNYVGKIKDYVDAKPSIVKFTLKGCLEIIGFNFVKTDNASRCYNVISKEGNRISIQLRKNHMIFRLAD